MPSRADFFRRSTESLLIRNKESKLVPLTFNSPQNLVWEKYLKPKLDAKQSLRFMYLKARQVGISTQIQGLMASRFMWDEHVNIKTIAHEGESTKNIWGMAERMVTLSPLGPYVEKAGTTMELGGSTLSCATAGSPHATRSMNITCLHLSEVGFWLHPEAWLAALQTVPIRGESWVFVESTANGKNNEGELFYDEWVRAGKGRSSFTRIFIPWFDLIEYTLPNYVYAKDWTPAMADVLVLDELDLEEMELKKQFSLSAGQLAWRRLIIEDQCQGNVELFHQEYPSTPEEAFIQSGLPLFSSKDLIPMRASIRSGEHFRLEHDGRFVKDSGGYLEIWKAPEPGHSYIIGADTSMGFDDAQHSRSAAEVLDADTLEQVAEYDCASPTYVMARHLAILGRRYNEALLAPEITASGGGGGRELLQYLLKDHHYYRIYRYKHVDHIKQDAGRMWGWETNMKTRSRMINRIVEVVKEKICTIHSESLLTQLQSFGESDTGRYESLAGKDDLLFAFGIGCAVWGEEHYHVTPSLDHARMTAEQLKAAGLTVEKDLSDDWADAWDERFVKSSKAKNSWLAM